jgi:prevent-host-death family protein
MKTLQIKEIKTNFSSIIKEVENGNEVAISHGNKNQTIAVIISYEKWKKNLKRQLGTLEGKMTVEFSDNFAITDNELVNL